MIRRILFIGILLNFAGLIPTVTPMTINKDQIDTSKQSSNARYASSIEIDDVLGHLDALQDIATSTNGNRAVRTLGFNRTLDYITDYLASNTNFKVTKTFFNLRTFQLFGIPTFSSTINGVTKTYTYSSILSRADFYHIQYSTSIDVTRDILLTAIPNLGCSDEDWLAASPSSAGIVALVKRGECTFQMKAAFATKYNVAALLIYNDGSSSSNMAPIYISLGRFNRIPALFLSYSVGASLASAANDPLQTVAVRLTIKTDEEWSPVGNICADTLTGDPTKTIVVGSHSDSVTAGPGINDNGQLK